MDFAWTPEQESIRKRAARFAEEHLAPHASQWDKDSYFPEEALRACARAGLTGLTVPKDCGGPGASPVSYALAISEIAAGCSSVAVTVAVTSMVAETIAKLGTPEQSEKYVKPILSGEFPAASFGLSEPGAGSDPASMRTRGVFEGDDIIINGEKTWITSGTHAGVFVVWVKTGEGPGTKGISAFLVEPGDPGFRVGRKETKMGLRASTTVSLEFEDCRIPVSRRLGKPGKGFHVAMQALDGGRIGISSQGLGIAKAALRCVDDYCRVHPDALTEKDKVVLAKNKAEYAAARLMCIQAAYLKGEGGSFSDKAAMSKAYCTEMANRVCQDAVQLLGEDGCTDIYPVERLFRDCKVTTIYEGTSEVQRIVISRAFLRD